MIDYEQFLELGAGDLVWWIPGGYVRTVLDGPRDHPDRQPFRARGLASIVMPIRRRSWTKRPITYYGFNDVRHTIRAIPRRTLGLMTAEELQRLSDCGWSPSVAIAAEIADHEALASRMGKSPCRSLQRARKKAQALTATPASGSRS